MGQSRFTIYHGLAASLALHVALGLPFALYALTPAPEEPPTLVVELQGVVTDSQSEQKVQQETAGAAQQDAAAAQPAPPAASNDPPAEAETEEKQAATPPAPAEPRPATPASEMKSGSGGSVNVAGADEQQNAQTIRTEPALRISDFRAYVKVLTKRIEAKLVYPEEGRRAGWRGAATVSFTLLPTGQIRPESLKIIASSGQPKLDESALQTVRASVPFEPPPQEMTVAIAVAFGRKH